MRTSIHCYTLPVRLAALALLSLHGSGCAAGDGTPGSGPVIDTLPGGVVRVINSGPTAWTDTNGWRLVLERVVQPPEDSPDRYTLPQGLVADSAGNVYILEGRPARIRVYDSTGHWTRDIGRRGEGPGEFLWGWMGLINNQLLAFHDPSLQRLTLFTLEGAVSSLAHSQCCIGMSGPLPVFRDSTILISGPAPKNRPQAVMADYLTRPDGSTIDTIVSELSDEIMLSHSVPGLWIFEGERSSYQVEIPLYPQDRKDYLPSGQMVIGNTGEYRLAVTDLHGDTLRIFSAPAPILKVSKAEREELYEAALGPATSVAMIDRAEVRSVAKLREIPKTRPVWSAIKVDGAERIWVSRPGINGEHSILDVFTKKGILLGRVPIPNPGIMKGYWTASHIYYSTFDDQDQPMVKVYRIVTGS